MKIKDIINNIFQSINVEDFDISLNSSVNSNILYNVKINDNITVNIESLKRALFLTSYSDNIIDTKNQEIIAMNFNKVKIDSSDNDSHIYNFIVYINEVSQNNFEVLIIKISEIGYDTITGEEYIF